MRDSQITDWNNQLLARATGVFGCESTVSESKIDFKALHNNIGQLTPESDFLEGALINAAMLNAKR